MASAFSYLQGRRKYLTAAELTAFGQRLEGVDRETATFCLVLMYTGARVSEVLNLTAAQIDRSTRMLVIQTLKRRKSGYFRAIPVPTQLIDALTCVHDLHRRSDTDRLWDWGRTTAWKKVKAVMRSANIAEQLATPRSLSVIRLVYVPFKQE